MTLLVCTLHLYYRNDTEQGGQYSYICIYCVFELGTRLLLCTLVVIVMCNHQSPETLKLFYKITTCKR